MLAHSFGVRVLQLVELGRSLDLEEDFVAVRGCDLTGAREGGLASAIGV